MAGSGITHNFIVRISSPHLLKFSPDACGGNDGDEYTGYDVEESRLGGIHQIQRYKGDNKTDRIRWNEMQDVTLEKKYGHF